MPAGTVSARKFEGRNVSGRVSRPLVFHLLLFTAVRITKWRDHLHFVLTRKFCRSSVAETHAEQRVPPPHLHCTECTICLANRVQVWPRRTLPRLLAAGRRAGDRVHVAKHPRGSLPERGCVGWLFFQDISPSRKRLWAIKKNHEIKSTYPMLKRIVIMFECTPTVRSPTNRKTLARIPA